MHRRDFLHPRHAAAAAGQAVALIDEFTPDAPPAADEVALLRLGWRAMATTFEMLTPLDTPTAVEAAREAFELLDELEDQLSAYREHSELCRLNRAAARRAVRVEERLFGLLELAGRLYRESDGAYDITAGALI